jgi:tRNA dimethylallyltransferase
MRNIISKNFDCVIITGPTASGKTDLSYELAKYVSGEIINADMGQFYTPCSIGTAKPDWKNHPTIAHLFDIIDNPWCISAFDYRKMVFKLIRSIKLRRKTPIIVGGSAFYIKSLFFPPIEKKDENSRTFEVESSPDVSVWQKLNEIDPERAQKIHPNDMYRVKRALAIWKTTGKKPSQFIPQFNHPFNSLIFNINPDKQILRQCIAQRAEHMIKSNSWIDEAKQLMETPWERFILKKKFIGYKQIFDWLRNGQQREVLPTLITEITQKTWQYAKRQLLFLDKCLRDLSMKQTKNRVSIITSVDNSLEKFCSIR